MMKRFLQRKNTRMYHVWLRSFMVCLCLALAGVSAWGQDNSYTFSGGIGTEDNPYLISSVEDLKEMVKMNSVSAHFKLNNDIDLGGGQWTPLNWVSYEEVVFDGAGKSITGLKIDGNEMTDPGQNPSLRVGLFSTIYHITIKNLTVEGEIINAKGNVGGICGLVNSSTIENCCSNVCITAVGASGGDLNVGGIAGVNGGIINKCRNEKPTKIEGKSIIDVSVGVYLGGIFGSANLGQVSECCNNGTLSISATIDSDVYVGGICGNMRGYTLENCYNQGAINVSECFTNGAVYVGGIIGYSELYTDNDAVRYCYNTGLLIRNDKKFHVGSICGLLRNWSSSYTCKIANSYYLNQEGLSVVGEGEVDENVVEGKDYVAFACGEVAWLLRNAGFGQDLQDENIQSPTLLFFTPKKEVYKLTLKYEQSESKEIYRNSKYLDLPETGLAPIEGKIAGWTDEKTGKLYTDDSEITDDLILKADYIDIPKYEVIVKVNDSNMGIVSGEGKYAERDQVTITATPNEGYELFFWDVEGVTETTKEGNTIKFIMPANNVTVTATFKEKEDPTDPEEPVDPPVDPINYYNIYNETTYDFIDVSFSRNVVREGGSVNVYLGIPEGLDPAAVTLMFKRSLYGGWENLNTDDDGNYLINNIWTDIYVKAVVDESYIDPNPDENHIYIDLSETNDSIWLYTDHKLVEEGKTAVIQAEVAKSCQNKEIRYMYKRTVLGEWKEMPKDYSINQYVVRDITTDIYVKAYFVFDKQDPTTAKNPHHVYADITATCEGLYLDATRHKVADEGDTKVFLYVKKGFETKDARYLFKRGLKGEWEDLVPGIEQNTFQVTDIEGDIYLKGIDAIYTGTEDIDGMVRVYTKDGSLFVYTAQPEEISVVSMTGVTVKRTRQTGLQSYPLNQGIYVICVGEQVFKVRVK